MLSFVCVLYTHTTTLGVLQLLPLMLTQGKKSLSLTAMVPWFPGLPQEQGLHGSSEAPFAPGCCMFSVLLVTWDAAVLSSYPRGLITVGLSPALQRPEKTPGSSDNSSDPQNAATHDGLCCSLLCAPLGFIYAFLNRTVIYAAIK